MIITGASRGIGAATAQLAAAQGFSAAVNYRVWTFRSFGSSTQHPGRGGKAVAIQADVAKDKTSCVCLPRPSANSAPYAAWSTTQQSPEALRAWKPFPPQRWSTSSQSM